jgi:AbrB family looped-hinge helix DNA binding protein
MRRCWYRNAMRTTIDPAGRIVIPKPLRDELGLTGRQTLEITASDGRLQIEVPPVPLTLRRRGKSLAAFPDTALPPLSAATVRETLEQLRR